MSVTGSALRPVVVHLAHDHDPAALAVPGMDRGVAELTEPPGAAAARWFGEGVRKVTLPDPVDLAVDDTDAACADAVRRLVLVRELTGLGVAVDWRLRLPADGGADWRVYSHLQPPAELHAAPTTGTDDPLSQWRQVYYFDKCAYRRGPGFVQVRDRRASRLNLITIDDPAYLAVLDQVLDGAPVAEVDLDIARDFAAEGLVAQVGTMLVWLPYRLRRWPLPSMII